MDMRRFLFYYFFRWGGCAVGLVKPDGIDKYISVLKREFYQSGELGEDDIDTLVFATFPQGGACIYKF